MIRVVRGKERESCPFSESLEESNREISERDVSAFRDTELPVEGVNPREELCSD